MVEGTTPVMANGALSDEAATKIRQQVEFYFSDSNLPNDKFLLRSVESSDDGLVSIAVVCAFQKMKSHLQLAQDVTAETLPKETLAAVAEALKSCPSLKISDDGLRVGRTSKLLHPEEARANLYARSVAVSPLPWKATREEIEAFFGLHSKPYSVRMPRHPSTKSCFSGFAVIEFSSPEEAQRVSALGLKFKGADLKFQSRESFETYWNALPKPSVSIEEDVFPKGLIVRFTLEKSKKKTEASEMTEGEKKTEAEAKQETKEGDDKRAETKGDDKQAGAKEGDGEVEKNEKEAEKNEKKESDQETQPELVREDIKAVLEEYAVVKFIDFSRGDTAGYVRFETAEGAEKARTAAVVSEEGGLIIKGRLATFEALQGADESEYWRKVRGSQTNKRKDFNRNKGSGRFSKSEQQAAKRSKAMPAATGKHVRLDAAGDKEDEPESKLQRTS